MNGIFHPAIVSWFSERYGTPTSVQSEAWPIISRGENVLVVAPTGTGKTLAAFLWALNQLITGAWTGGATRVLYVSPLRALNNDIRRNLIVPLRELETLFRDKGLSYPSIDVKTRSGDTPMDERRRMLRHPPEIFITTPESLNLILSSPRARGILSGVQTIILDEIHAVVNSKRGVHLMSAVERVVPLSGEFQRIALSATVQPMETVSAFIGGYTVCPDDKYKNQHARSVCIVSPEHEKQYDVSIQYPEAAASRTIDESLWDVLADELLSVVRSRVSTLIFANSRRLTERITLKINEHASELLAYAHHGSLSREIRSVVERRLKAGELRAIVATNSLELGIDIGALDTVVLVQCPGSISSAVQRIGRAGHSVGSVSTGIIFPTHPFDIIESAVVTRAVQEHDIEPVQPVQNALDVLAQIIISMTVVEPWDIDELFHQIRMCYSYHSLTRTHFDIVLRMLEGMSGDSRIREVKSRILVDRISNTITALGGARLALYSSGGVIPDRGYYRLRTQESEAIIGDLDEEFVWEAKRGQVFTLGTQHWKIEQITHNDVFVRPASPGESSAPFWKGERRSRDPHFSELIGKFLEDVNARLNNPGLHDELSGEYHLDETACDQIIAFLKRQRQHTGCSLPHRHHMVIEHIDTGPGGVPGKQIVLHSMWGSNVNLPYAFALERAWEERYGHRPRLYATNDTITIILSEDIPGFEILSLVSGSTVEELLRSHLPESGIFGAHFRENAGRALLLGPRKFGERMPLWMSRLHSQKLMEAVVPYPEFPITLETWRSIIEDEFDLPRLSTVIEEIEVGRISVSESRSAYPSPFAQASTWNQINEYMYMGDENRSNRQSAPVSTLIRDLLTDESFRPRIHEWIIDDFENKRLRLYPGYHPATAIELLAYVKERGFVQYEEWIRIVQSIENTTDITSDSLANTLQMKLCCIQVPRARQPIICSMERVHELVSNVYGYDHDVEAREVWSDAPVLLNISSPSDHHTSLQSFLSEWLGFYGPRALECISKDLGIPETLLRSVLTELRDSGKLIYGILREHGSIDEYCDAENLETLLRLQRRSRRRSVSTIDSKWLPFFLAAQQGISASNVPENAFISVIDQLSLYPLPAWLWESDVLVARCTDFRTEWTDRLLHGGAIRWMGHGKEQIMFCYPDDLDLIADKPDHNGTSDQENERIPLDDLFPDREAMYDFTTLLRRTDYDAMTLNKILWAGVWDGLLSNNGFDVVRRGVRNRFAINDDQTRKRPQFRTNRISRRHFSRWHGSLPAAGLWYRIISKFTPRDLLDEEEIKKERVRLLLGRYGILCRELLRREIPLFSWSELFKTMRIMELSGEIAGGRFFGGLSGPQFMFSDALSALDALPKQSARFWLNAADPASMCGIPEIKDVRLPRRLPVNHVVYSGTELICVSIRNGKSLTFFVEPDNPDMEICMDLLMHLFTRPTRTVRRIRIESINEEYASNSPYEAVLKQRFEIQKDRQSLIMHRTFA